MIVTILNLIQDLSMFLFGIFYAYYNSEEGKHKIAVIVGVLSGTFLTHFIYVILYQIAKILS